MLKGIANLVAFMEDKGGCSTIVKISLTSCSATPLFMSFAEVVLLGVKSQYYTKTRGD